MCWRFITGAPRLDAGSTPFGPGRLARFQFTVLRGANARVLWKCHSAAPQCRFLVAYYAPRARDYARGAAALLYLPRRWTIPP